MNMIIRFGFVINLVLLSMTSQVFANESKTPLRILHVPSYHMSWDWNKDQFQGFKDGVGDLNVEYQVVELDTKRASDPSVIEKKVAEAKALVKSWKPDLLYTNDDNAQKYFAQSYINTELPIVFSAVNRPPSNYGFVKAKNVTGVMEYEHFIPTINLLRSISKDVKRIAVIIDSDPTWKGVVARTKENLKKIPDLQVTDWILVNTYSDYKEIITSLQDTTDAIALLGIFNLKDEKGNDVDYKKVLKWTADNSQLPDFSYWESRVDEGTLCAVAVSGYQQGHLAGEMARKILFKGVSPNDIPISSSDKGEPMVSLARAQKLGLNLDVQILLNSTVKKIFAWDE